MLIELKTNIEAKVHRTTILVELKTNIKAKVHRTAILVQQIFRSDELTQSFYLHNLLLPILRSDGATQNAIFYYLPILCSDGANQIPLCPN